MNELISVIIPVYNRKAYLKECVDSVIAQSYGNFEIVIVDDGSTDGSVELCRTLAEPDGRIRVFLAEHEGVSAARNRAIENSRGSLLFFLDSDDILHPRLFETFVKTMSESGAELAGTQVVNISERYWRRAYELIEREKQGETQFLPYEHALHETMTGTSPIGVIGGVMMKRELVGDTRFKTDLFIGEDFFFVYENLIKGASAVFLKEKWYYCRHHAENSSWDFGYTGFMKRLYRRELVWKSELSFGRVDYANRQKIQVLDIFFQLLAKNKADKEEISKMCKKMKEYKSELFTAFRFKTKILYYMCVYFPFSYPLVARIKGFLRKMR